MKRRILIPAGVIAALLLAYLAGPRPDFSPPEREYRPLDLPAADLDRHIGEAEAAVPGIKPGNTARIVWADSAGRTTPWAIVYLHGFTASHAEGDPLHRQLAQRYGANLYLSRLAGHGIDDRDAMRGLTPNELLTSARNALAIGEKLGERVVLMGTSSGATYAIWLAATYPDKVDGLILLSPNIAIADPSAKLLTYPWGWQIAEWTLGGEYRGPTNMPVEYWSEYYHIDALLALQGLLEATMTDATFRRVRQPFFMGYYYKDEEEQDRVVSVPAMRDFFQRAGTPPARKSERAFATVGDHVIGSHLTSRDLPAVAAAIDSFVQEKLGWRSAVRQE